MLQITDILKFLSQNVECSSDDVVFSFYDRVVDIYQRLHCQRQTGLDLLSMVEKSSTLRTHY